ncbi:1-deoxy-D-xylulose-5-phosphate synthase [Syntrophotalea acetylenivorans]|uniref:1-deoxy-D-xylulose-5-phosphate synthase n=1 Tax=Syntrophotalea acetylenivorans TaxID=1842532 RepID=A0A1L3GLQ0_9BACT|nr:1-deoxy-D-xylulose-5-phosphate synthase [Syntrophotalea acetylenivorans]APG26852.1 1-deoxy-D-xylulose-5-phosphate synthase [Syntrophotalea acetylenivorans]
MSILQQLQSPAELKDLSQGELEQLTAELREKIISTVSATGGHLASSLGVVELTVALHRVLNSPEDKIVWDVGHQAYAHKLLTGRLEQFHTLRQLGGISGFPKRQESPHDAFDVGHSSTSISAALGMAAARDCQNKQQKMVAVIGDGSLTGGLAFEGLNHAGHLNKNLIVVLNDNEMSISPNVGAISSLISRKLTSELAVRLKKEAENFLNHVPRFGKDLLKVARRAEEALKGFFTPGMLFEALGFEYVGPLNGHRLDQLVDAFENVVNLDGPVLVHVVSRKGRGYQPAEENPSLFHGIGPFDRETGVPQASKGGKTSYTGVFGKTLVQQAEQDERIVAITAAMLEGTGLKDFSQCYPDRFFDVGIAEQHAVTFAAGLASQGLRPTVALYSTFLQRAYDNVVHDVALQNLPVTFAIDRAGLVGADGPTHHGVFDFSYLRHIPNLTIMAPRDELELQRAMVTATTVEGPFAYRYPRGQALGLPLGDLPAAADIGRGEKLRDGTDGVVFALGVVCRDALQAAAVLEKEGLSLAVIDARFLAPLDRSMISDEARRTGLVFTVEENVLAGGFGSAILELLAEEQLTPRVLRMGLPDSFVEQGTQQELRALCGIDGPGIAKQIRKFCNMAKPEPSEESSN